MRRDLLKRLEALENDAAERITVWIGPPESGLAGWEVIPPAGGSIEVWREAGETDDDLQARAAAEANRHRGMVVAFGMDERGITR